MGTALAVSAIGGMAASAASGAMGMMGSAAQARQAKANAQMQADIENYNKKVEELEAARVEKETAENIRRQQIESGNIKATQRAMLGKSGVIASGSPLAVLAQTAVNEEIKARDIAYAGYQKSMQHRENAKKYAYRAALAKAQAPSGLSTALNIAGQAASTVGNMAQIGGSYISGKANLMSTGMAGKSLFG
jgi:hypothetical protein